MKREETGYIYPKDISVHLPAFDCPKHGIEIESFCPHAFDEYYIKRWGVFSVRGLGPMGEEEGEKMLVKRKILTSRFAFLDNVVEE